MLRSSHIYVPQLSFVNKVILILVGISFIFQILFEKLTGFSAAPYIGLSIQFFFGGHIQQAFTYVLVQEGLMQVLFDGLIIWFIGSELEHLWGRKTYLQLILTAVIFTAAFYIGFSYFFSFHRPLLGITSLSYSLLLAYGILFPNRILTFMLIFPMKAKYFCLILMGILLFGAMASGVKSHWGHLGGMLGTFFFMYFLTFYRRKKREGCFSRNRKKSFFRQHKKTNLRLVKKNDNKGDDSDQKYIH